MKLIELSTDHLTNAQEMARAIGGARSTGTHISEVIRSLQNLVVLPGKRKPYDQLSGEERRRMGNYTSMGWAFEAVIERALREVWSVYWRSDTRYQKPGELFLDGMCGTPDWLDLQEWCVIEFKATWRSSRRDLVTDFVPWFWQIMSYCKLLNTRDAKLYTFFVNGNYRESGPQLKAWHVCFSEDEIEKNWVMLRQHARGGKRG